MALFFSPFLPIGFLIIVLYNWASFRMMKSMETGFWKSEKEADQPFLSASYRWRDFGLSLATFAALGLLLAICTQFVPSAP